MSEADNKVEEPNSCKIAINAKGMYSGEVKVYAETIDAAQVLAFSKAEELEILIRDKNSPPKPGAV